MLYKNPFDNLRYIMQTMGTLPREQLYKYFRYELSQNNLEFLLNQCVIRRILLYNEKEDTYTSVGAAHLSDDYQARMIKAFWLLAEAGSVNIKKVNLIQYPSEFMFISEEGKAFDVTIINNRDDALLAQRIRSITLAKGIEDPVTHIAILRNPNEAYMLKQCGFDDFCIIDPISKDVSYYRNKN